MNAFVLVLAGRNQLGAAIKRIAGSYPDRSFFKRWKDFISGCVCEELSIQYMRGHATLLLPRPWELNDDNLFEGR